MQVSVELKDLETLLYAAAAIKQIEQVLVQRKHDPFVKPEQEYKQAHDNLVAAMNSATRANSRVTVIEWDGSLTDEEIDYLKSVSSSLMKRIVPEVNAKERFDLPIDTLAAKGCVKIGQCVKGAIWPGQTQADLKSTDMFAVMITPRGRSKLEEAMTPKHIPTRTHDADLAGTVDISGFEHINVPLKYDENKS